MTLTLHRQRHLTLDDSILAANLPAGAGAYGAYVDGRWADLAAVRARFPRARILSIAVFARDNADCLDIENGDATPAQAAVWVPRQRRRGVHRPGCYESADLVDEVVARLTSAGLARPDFRLWSAHYGIGPHICGPDTCKACRTACDATQWTDAAPGLNGSRVDESLLLDDFFAGAVVPAVTEDDMVLIEHGKTPFSAPAGCTRLHFVSGEKREVTIQWIGGHAETAALEGMHGLDVAVPAGLRDGIIDVTGGIGGHVALSFD